MSTNEKEPETTSPEEVTEAETVPEEEGAKPEKKKLLTNPQHLILEAAHPSPLSAYNGFFGCRHFSKCNQFLVSKGVEPVNWQIH